MIGHHLCNDATQHNPVEKVPAFSQGRWADLASPTSYGKEDVGEASKAHRPLEKAGTFSTGLCCVASLHK